MSRFAFALACLALAGCSQQPLDTAPNVDLSRFQGKWYEIAKLPRLTQANCTGTTAFYTLRDGGIDLTSECHLDTLTGTLRSMSARAVVADGGDPAKLSLNVAGFWGDYFILEVGEHYEYAMVGVPSRDYLWILSRTPQLDKGRLDALVASAQAKRFDTSRLEYTVQGQAQ
jgi:apolipoprotein D and lipocalin family protein